jgi:hypothetical protein
MDGDADKSEYSSDDLSHDLLVKQKKKINNKKSYKKNKEKRALLSQLDKIHYASSESDDDYRPSHYQLAQTVTKNLHSNEYCQI